jgi:hypothetical protein
LSGRKLLITTDERTYKQMETKNLVRNICLVASGVGALAVPLACGSEGDTSPDTVCIVEQPNHPVEDMKVVVTTIPASTTTGPVSSELVNPTVESQLSKKSICVIDANGKMYEGNSDVNGFLWYIIYYQLLFGGGHNYAANTPVVYVHNKTIVAAKISNGSVIEDTSPNKLNNFKTNTVQSLTRIATSTGQPETIKGTGIKTAISEGAQKGIPAGHIGGGNKSITPKSGSNTNSGSHSSGGGSGSHGGGNGN